MVHDVDLQANPGEVTILVGPNGCGKSTLLKAMARVLKPMSGMVSLDGKNVHQMPTRNLARQLALLPQGPVAPEGLTVHELVSQGRFPHQSLTRQWSAEDSRAVSDAMQAADVTEFSDRRVDSLSGGQRQRCWIAMVLAQETDVILLDEPTTFLDLKVQVDVMTLLRAIAREKGRTLVVVLHELNIAAMFADQIVIMRNGRLIAQGAPERVITTENLAAGFGLQATVIKDPVTGRPVCLPAIAGPAI
ncbi:ABC transporter ATP-binding protein [Yoonia sp. 2307UL14-13]|uniref:ABC transporter ATP-binding protein n=1 Tax=Yoonia sp. 2307UL14-13 TaxID=3126506 RepID=UPI0030B22DB6